MSKVYKLDQLQVQKQLYNFNSSLTIDKIIKVSQFLSQYNLLLTEVIGCGAYGVVLKGYDDNNSREVAKKELEEEIKIIREIKSENIIKIYGHFYDEESSCLMIVMEYCKNGNLHSYFNNKKILEKEEIIKLFTHFLVGLQDIHTKGIIHSEIKPQNILLAENYNLKICVLGLSKIISNQKSLPTNKVGIQIYQSQEQMSGKVRIESDYYSAGAVLCFLSGLDIENNLTLASQLKNGVFPDINNMKYKQLIEIGFQMMQLDPLQRIQPEIASRKLINLQDNNSDQIRSQRESQKEKKIKNGIWIYFWNNGRKYEGEWKNDKMNGQGILYLQNGDKYEGEFKDNQYSGQGTYYYHTGDKYVGKWEKDFKNGYGVYYYNDGDSYQGEWKDCKKKGLGIYYEKSGGKFVGNWKNDEKNGNGVQQYISGNSYEGGWKENKKSGYATFYFCNGDKYVGSYLNNKRNGEGIYYFSNGKIESQFHIDKVLQQKQK